MSIFGNFFRRETVQPIASKQETRPPAKPEIKKDIETPAEARPKMEFKLEDITIDSSMGRILVHIPIEISNRAGGHNAITRDIFPKLFKGSYPVWTEEFDDEYVIEMPRNEAKIEEFRRAMIDRASN